VNNIKKKIFKRVIWFHLKFSFLSLILIYLIIAFANWQFTWDKDVRVIILMVGGCVQLFLPLLDIEYWEHTESQLKIEEAHEHWNRIPIKIVMELTGLSQEEIRDYIKR
jgi:hypothetical protein